jgi:hypothetical protein
MGAALAAVAPLAMRIIVIERRLASRTEPAAPCL